MRLQKLADMFGRASKANLDELVLLHLFAIFCNRWGHVERVRDRSRLQSAHSSLNIYDWAAALPLESGEDVSI